MTTTRNPCSETEGAPGRETMHRGGVHAELLRGDCDRTGVELLGEDGPHGPQIDLRAAGKKVG
jgi:hypothetical protein